MTQKSSRKANDAITVMTPGQTTEVTMYVRFSLGKTMMIKTDHEEVLKRL